MKMKELFDSPEKWVKFRRGVDEYGEQIDPNDYYAVGWCILGGIDKCYDVYETPRYEEIREKIYEIIKVDLSPLMIDLCEEDPVAKDVAVANWNNAAERTFDDILRVIDQIEPDEPKVDVDTYQDTRPDMSFELVEV